MPRKRAFPFACMRETVVPNTKTKGSEGRSKFSCISEAHESTRQRAESATKRIHEKHIAGKGQNSELHHNQCINLSRYTKMKIPDSKTAVDKKWKKLETIPAWDVRKVKSKKETIFETQKNNNFVHCAFASLMDFCHLKNSELEPQFQKCKGSVVPRGDDVKDDSGAHAVFTEQGSQHHK